MEKLDLSVLKDIDKKVLIIWGISLIVVILFLFLILIPSFSQYRSLLSQLKKIKTEVNIIKQKITQVPKLETDRNDYLHSIEEAEAKLFTESDLTKLVGELSNIANKVGVKMVSSRPKEFSGYLPEGFTNRYQPNSFELELEGGYHQLGRFLNGLDFYPKLLVVDEIRILPSEGQTQLLKINLALVAFSLASKEASK